MSHPMFPVLRELATFRNRVHQLHVQLMGNSADVLRLRMLVNSSATTELMNCGMKLVEDATNDLSSWFQNNSDLFPVEMANGHGGVMVLDPTTRQNVDLQVLDMTTSLSRHIHDLITKFFPLIEHIKRLPVKKSLAAPDIHDFLSISDLSSNSSSSMTDPLAIDDLFSMSDRSGTQTTVASHDSSTLNEISLISAFQTRNQPDMLIRHGQKSRSNFSRNVVHILKTWIMEHERHPYPNDDEKRLLSNDTGLTLVQVNNWFINARRRILGRERERKNGKNKSRCAWDCDS